MGMTQVYVLQQQKDRMCVCVLVFFHILLILFCNANSILFFERH